MSETKARQHEATATLGGRPGDLAVAWSELRDRKPKIRIRDAAIEIGVSEAELLVTLGNDRVRRIDSDMERWLPRLEPLGELMALTRNEVFVHEKTGVYRNVSVKGHAAQVLDHDIDLRLFPSQFRYGFAARTDGRAGELNSLQFFDAHGTAVHKVYLREGSDVDAYEALVGDLLVEDQSLQLDVEPPASAPVDRPDADIEVPEIEEAWRELRDTHDFFHLLRRFEVGRTQAFRLVSEELARPASTASLRRVLDSSAADDIPLMVFVNSPGVFQIHHGPVERVVEMEPWLNVMDPGFNLHVREDLIASSWVVQKPVDVDRVTSVEFFDADDRLCALVFGERQEGEAENEAWRALATGLPRSE